MLDGVISMMVRLRIHFVMVLVILGMIGSAQAQGRRVNPKPLHIVFFNPSSESDSFWSIFTAVTQAAAEDLQVELEIIYTNRDYRYMLEQLRSVVNRSDKPDGILLKSLKGSGLQAIDIANNAEIPIFLVNAGVDYNQAGQPRETYPFWIGDRLPNDVLSGEELATLLIESALQSGVVGKNGKVNMLALSGSATDAGALGRVQGLEKAVAAYGDKVLLHQVVVANWSATLAAEKIYWLLGRYPDLQVIWSANDGMALGAAQTARKEGWVLGSQYPERGLDNRLLIGGAAWIPDIFEPIKQGEILVSMGGPTLDGAWSLIALYDYLHGRDFANTRMRTRRVPLTGFNIDDYLEYFGDSNWSKIDFTAFSKVHHPEISDYTFTLEALFAQLRPEDNAENP